MFTHTFSRLLISVASVVVAFLTLALVLNNLPSARAAGRPTFAVDATGKPQTPSAGLPYVIDTIPIGTDSWPMAIAVNPNDAYVYIANGLSNTVTILADTQVITNIKVDNGPRIIGINPNTGYVYVGNAISNTVTVIKGTQVIATLPTGNFPYGIGINPATGFVYVANWDDDSVTILKDTHYITTVPVAHNPDAIGINPVTGYVYVGGRNSYNVTVLSATQVITTLTMSWGPAAIGADPATGYVYVALSNSGVGVSVISGTQIISNLTPGLPGIHTAIKVSRVSGYVYALQNDSLWVISGTNIVNTIPLTNPFGVCDLGVSAITNYAYVTNQSSSNNVVVASGADEVGSIGVGRGPCAIGTSPTNGLVYVVNFFSDTVSILREASIPQSLSPFILPAPDDSLVIDFGEPVVTPTIRMEITPTIPATATWSVSNDRVTIMHDPFESGTPYTLSIRTNGEAESGIPVLPASFIYTYYPYHVMLPLVMKNH